MRKLMLGIGMFLGFSVAFAATPESAQELMISTVEQTLAKLKAKKEFIKKNPEYLNALVNEYVVPRFDFERSARWVLGKYWRKATPEQRKQFIIEFKNLLVRTYATSLSEYSDQKITYLPFRGKSGAEEVTVRSEVEQAGGFPIPIDYRLHKKNGEWKVFDVVIDDISLIANYRTSFGREIRKTSIGDLIKRLATRNAESKS